MHASAEAAVGAGDDVLAADRAGEPHDPLGDQLRVLHQVGGMADDPRNEDLALGQPDLLEHVVLVLVARVRRLERIRSGLDLQDDGDNWEVLSAPDAFQAVLEAVKKLGIEPEVAEVSMMPQNYLKLEGKQAQQMIRLMEALDDHDDIRHVWSNVDIEEKEIEASLA